MDALKGCRSMRVLCSSIILISALLSAVTHSEAQEVEQFYRGKHIIMLVGSGVGGGYDVYARAFARHASKHIQGNPTIVARNLPLAGGMVAANTLYNNSSNDETSDSDEAMQVLT